MKHEYHEGLEAKERFDKLATRFFRAPKPIVKPATKPVRKPKKTKCYVACAVYTAIMLNETPFEFMTPVTMSMVLGLVYYRGLDEHTRSGT
jgi:hypothetical protein